MVRVLEIEGAASAQLPLRVLGLFAQQDVLPTRIAITCEDDSCRMRLEEFGMDDVRLAIIAEKLRSMVMVARVTLFDQKG